MYFKSAYNRTITREKIAKEKTIELRADTGVINSPIVDNVSAVSTICDYEISSSDISVELLKSCSASSDGDSKTIPIIFTGLKISYIFPYHISNTIF